MEEEIIIEYTLTKAEAEKIYFRRNWIKQVMPNIIFSIVLLPLWIMLGMSFGVTLDHVLGFEGKTADFFSIVMIIFIMGFFFVPVFKLYSVYKKQLSVIYRNNNIQLNKLQFTKDKFNYENEIFCIEGPWSNSKLVKIDKDYIIFQLKVPNVFFIIPNGKVSEEVKNVLIKNIPQK